MDARTTGRFIALKRKEHAMTQEQLAEQLGVSGKAVSKWETGRCLPDCSIMEPLCDALDITFNELMSGKAVEQDQQLRTAEAIAQQALDVVEQLQREKRVLIGIVVITLGMASFALGHMLTEPSTSPIIDFMGGFLIGSSVVEVVVGVFVTIRSLMQANAMGRGL